ncbi:hypothetical protein [Arsenophonus endosymbiont of Bemisia tabaci]|nr:hypothetical protein [Arsenophonus endosymbiont of Bemisia tabaci]CAA2930141.1 hypothetical protein ARSQ2_01262 [Arsenophonus endosymbiont of Bemisia tabaci Q2]
MSSNNIANPGPLGLMGFGIAKRLNFDYKIYVFLQYKFSDIE